CRRAGGEYGPFYDSFAEFRLNQTEAVAWLEVPETARAGVDGFELHPALLDGAIQLCGAHQLWKSGGSSELSIPFSAENVEVLQALPERVFVHVRCVGSATYCVEWINA